MGSDADLNSGNAATPGVIGGGNQASAPQADASPAPVASSGPEAAQSLKGALAALDRRDYSTARRLFEALGRKDAAEAIDSALAALDRKDFAAAQGLFEALALPKLAPGMEDLAAPEAPGEAREKPAAPPLESAPFVDPEDRPRAPRAERPGKRSLRPHLLGVSAGAAGDLRGGGRLCLTEGRTARGGLWPCGRSSRPGRRSRKGAREIGHGLRPG